MKKTDPFHLLTAMIFPIIVLLFISCGGGNNADFSMPPLGGQKQPTWALPADYHKQMDLTPTHLLSVDLGFVLTGHDDSVGTMLVRGYGPDGKKVWGQRLEGTCFGAVARGQAVAVLNILVEPFTNLKDVDFTYELVFLSATTGEIMQRHMPVPNKGMGFSRLMSLGPDGSIYLVEEQTYPQPIFNLLRISPDGSKAHPIKVDLPHTPRVEDILFLPSGELLLLGSIDPIGDTLVAAHIDTTGRVLHMHEHYGLSMTKLVSCITPAGDICVTGYPFEGTTVPWAKLTQQGQMLSHSAEAGISQELNIGMLLHPLPNDHLLVLGAAVIDTLTDGSKEGMLAELDADGHLLRQERAKFGRIYELAGFLPISEGKWLIAYQKNADLGYNGYLELITF